MLLNRRSFTPQAGPVFLRAAGQEPVGEDVDAM
jgi:hypothetical protein